MKKRTPVVTFCTKSWIETIISQLDWNLYYMPIFTLLNLQKLAYSVFVPWVVNGCVVGRQNIMSSILIYLVIYLTIDARVDVWLSYRIPLYTILRLTNISKYLVYASTFFINLYLLTHRCPDSSFIVSDCGWPIPATVHP